MDTQSGLSKVFGTFILMLIGLALTPTIQEEVLRVSSAGSFGAGLPNSTFNNLTGAARAIVVLVPLFWVVIIIGVGLGAIYYFMK